MLNEIRTGLGRMVAVVDALTTPQAIERSAEAQAKVDLETASLALYQFEFCPFCIKTRRAMKRLALKIELRDAKTSPHQENLVQGGGELQVPCLQITYAQGGVKWMYESDDIIQYLEQRFGSVGQA